LCSSAKRAVLTINRGDVSKTYSSPASSASKKEVRAQAASIAIMAGALEFIATGNENPEPYSTLNPQPSGVPYSQSSRSTRQSMDNSSSSTALTQESLASIPEADIIFPAIPAAAPESDSVQQIENHLLEYHTAGRRTQLSKLIKWYHLLGDKNSDIRCECFYPLFFDAGH
jgi:hypothetical protein